MKGLAILVGKGKPEADEEPTSERYKPSEEEDEGDEFGMGFEAFRSALKSGDATKAKKAFRLMKEACDDDEEM